MTLGICGNLRFIRENLRFSFFDADGRKWPQMAANFRRWDDCPEYRKVDVKESVFRNKGRKLW